MTRGMYAAAGGMLIGLDKQDVLTNNLSNANTPGFKMDRVTYGSFQEVLLPGITDANGNEARMKQSATLNASEVDVQPGALTETGNQLDLGVTGPGWFAVMTDRGERYTRNGHFTRSADGVLSTSEGWPVLGENGPLRIPSSDLTISDDGAVFASGTRLGRLKMVQFANPRTLTKDGVSLQAGGGPVPMPADGIQQGMLENSNADPMRVMVEMLATMRGFEVNQRVIQAQDQTLQSVLDIARR